MSNSLVMMSESGMKGSSAMESQDTCSESLEQRKSLNNTVGSSINESQDFHLVDLDEEESSDKSVEAPKEAQVEDVSSSSLSDKAEAITGGIEAAVEVEKETEADVGKEKFSGEEEAQEVGSSAITENESAADDAGNSENKSKHSDEEEEIIQCTPPDVYSPSKKQAPSNPATTLLKRKAGSFDEPPTKVLRTLSREDASEKRGLEEEESSHSFKSEESHQEFPKNCSDTNIIIAETQDAAEDEDIEDTLEKHSKDEEIKDGKVSESQIKDYEMDKNENFNDASKMNDAITNKESKEKTCDMKNVPPSNDNSSSPVQTAEKDSTLPSKAVTVEAAKSDINNKNSDSVKPAGDKDTKVAHSEKTEDKENGIESARHTISEQKSTEVQETSMPKKTTNESHCTMNSTNTCKSRNSIELIYDRTAVQEVKSKCKEIVEIDEDGEKIVLDSSQEDSDSKSENKNVLDNTKAETIYKSCYDSKSSSDFSYKSLEHTKESSIDSMRSSSKLVNGSTESKRCDTDSTASLQSDTFSDIPIALEKADSNISTFVHNVNKQHKPVASVSKDNDHAELLSVSDQEPDVYIVDDKNKSNLNHSNSLAKALQVEKEIGIYVRMKCLLHVDEGTKEFLGKEITGVQCEPITEPTLIRQKNNDTSASLADISGNDNKDASPGSVNSNPQLYPLNPSSRLSFASTISSLSSGSSAASLAAKLAMRDSTHFSLPRAPAKHAKKHAQDLHSFNDKQALDEAYERLTKEWQNSHLLTTTILNFTNTELSGIDTHNISNERIDDQLQKIRSSTPEVPQEVVQAQTPKSSKKSKAVKRPRSKSTKLDNQANGLNKDSVKIMNPTESSNTPNRKKNKIEHSDNTPVIVEVPKKSLSQAEDDLIGNTVFAKWSDNNYYPGTVIDKVKAKYKVNFYDGKSKVLIEDFVITIPQVLKEGLSVYATTKSDDYGSCGIITDVQTVNNEVYYTVETDEGEKLQVQVKDIFLSSDQAQVLKEEIGSETKSVPSTPKHLSHITLDNMVDGKRRSKRISTPVFSTPKSKLMHTPSRSAAEPSVSGIASTAKSEKKMLSESEGTSSDSNASVREETSLGVQPEIIGTPYEQIVKGPQNRIKSKSRSKKKAEDEETIATYGPIPRADSNLFKGMSFILTCAPLETIDRYQVDNKDYSSDTGTENEEDWVKKAFIRDRLTKQIEAGGGKVYTDFNEIPQGEYKSTKLITNVPNTTAKTLLCLSVGIPVYNHNWIIRCCQEGKIVNPAEDELPTGWSLDKQSYVEMFRRPSNKPLTQVVVIIPVVESERQFISFWRQICENIGAVVLLPDKPDPMEGFDDGTVVLTNRSCPSWAVERATELQIPLLSTTWVVQCLIEGKVCPYNSQIRYKYNYIQN